MYITSFLIRRGLFHDYYKTKFHEDRNFAPDEELDCLSVDDIVTERDRSDKIMATYEGQIEKEYPAYLALKEKHERIQKEVWEQLLKRNS